MWLINVKSHELEFFNYEQAPKYAILSHTWEGDEVLFADMRNAAARAAASSSQGAKSNIFDELQAAARTSQGKTRSLAKLFNTCRQARKDNISYVWVDNCCINKESSAELSEGINSMWKWYKNARICYAYLADASGSYIDGIPGMRQRLQRASAALDVGSKEPVAEFGSGADARAKEYLTATRAALEHCRWFTRGSDDAPSTRVYMLTEGTLGWTLQELIAPGKIEFYDAAWTLVGHKRLLTAELSAITRIDANVMSDARALQSTTVAARMSWASHRTTTRIEDQAYSLMGLFDINMPMLYGEGAKAFFRLQEEIIKTCTDQSVFAWNFNPYLNNGKYELLAPTPACFRHCGDVKLFSSLEGWDSSYELNNGGLRITLPMFESEGDVTKGEHGLAALNCYHARTNTVAVLVLAGLSFYARAQKLPVPCYSYHDILLQRKAFDVREAPRWKIRDVPLIIGRKYDVPSEWDFA